MSVFLKVHFAGQIPKELAYPDDNEDSVSFSDDGVIVALVDGASESYEARRWGALLAEGFLADPNVNREWVESQIARYKSGVEFKSLPWNEQEAYQRGSHATLLGIKALNEREIGIWGIGDTVAVLVENGKLTCSFPYATAQEFNKPPALLSTIGSHNAFCEDANFRAKYQTTWSIEDPANATVLSMTDAIARWAFYSVEADAAPWPKLCQITDISGLETLVFSERAARNMRLDDSTLIRLSLERRTDHELPDSGRLSESPSIS